MKWLMKAIRAAAAAMRRLVLVTVRVSDRLISMLMPAPMPAIDELEPEPAAPDPSRDTGSQFMPIRNLAYARLQGTMPTPAMLAAAGRLQTEWISAMSPAMLKAVLLADDKRLHLHMRGIECIKGVLRYDEKIIDDYRVAMLRQRAAEEAARRRMHDVRYA